MAKKKYQSVKEMHDEFRDKQIAELTQERFNIITYDIRYALSVLSDFERNIGILRVLMSEKYKNNLREKFPNGDIDKINMRDVMEYRDKIEANLICLEPALNSVKQIERLPSVAEIVSMIENGKEVRIIWQ